MSFNKRRDAFEYKLIDKSEDVFGRIFNLTPIPIIVITDKRTLLNVNAAALQLIKVRNIETAKTWFTTHQKSILAGFKSTMSFSEYEVAIKDGRQKSVDLLVRIKNAGKNQLIITLQDVTARKIAEKKLTRLAQVDGLTGLLNHKTIVRHLQEELLRAKRYHLPFSCLLVDVDDFKVINDRFGHLKGDQILKKVAKALKVNLRESDLVGRYGGDEFLVILTETPMDQAYIPAKRIQHYLVENQPLSIKDISLTFSIGISGFPGKGQLTAKGLIARADKGLYISKKHHGNKIVVNEKIVK